MRVGSPCGVKRIRSAGGTVLPLPPCHEQVRLCPSPTPAPMALSESILFSCLLLPPARALFSPGLRFPGWCMMGECVLVALPLLTPPLCGPPAASAYMPLLTASSLPLTETSEYFSILSTSSAHPSPTPQLPGHSNCSTGAWWDGDWKFWYHSPDEVLELSSAKVPAGDPR